MRSVVLVAALIAAPAVAHDGAHKPAAAVAASTVVATPAAPAAATSRLNIDMPIEALAADPAGKAVLDANFPGMTTHAMYDSFKGMTLKQVQPMSNGNIKDEAVAKAKADLAAIK